MTGLKSVGCAYLPVIFCAHVTSKPGTVGCCTSAANSLKIEVSGTDSVAPSEAGRAPSAMLPRVRRCRNSRQPTRGF